MNNVPRKNKVRVSHLKMIAVMGIMVTSVGILANGFYGNVGREYHKSESPNGVDSAASIAAFDKVYQVLMSPRCMNCHPAGDIPLQGDDSHIHSMKPRRGKDGKGLYAMKCSN